MFTYEICYQLYQLILMMVYCLILGIIYGTVSFFLYPWRSFVYFFEYLMDHQNKIRIMCSRIVIHIIFSIVHGIYIYHYYSNNKYYRMFCDMHYLLIVQQFLITLDIIIKIIKM